MIRGSWQEPAAMISAMSMYALLVMALPRRQKSAASYRKIVSGRPLHCNSRTCGGLPGFRLVQLSFAGVLSMELTDHVGDTAVLIHGDRASLQPRATVRVQPAGNSVSPERPE